MSFNLRSPQLDTRLPMGVQGPNMLGAMAQGTQIAGAQNKIMRENELANVYRQHGAGIAAGDPNAYNALAGIDPMAVRQLKGDDREARMAEERLKLARAAGARAAANARNAREAREKIEMARNAIMQGVMAYEGGNIQGAQAALAPVLGDGVADMTQENARDFFTLADQALIGGQFGLQQRWGGQGPKSTLGKIQADINAGLLPADTPLRSNQITEFSTPDGFSFRMGADTGAQPVADVQMPPAEITPTQPVGNEAFGVEGVVKGAVNSVTDGAGFGEAFPEAGAQTRLFDDLRTDLLATISQSFRRQPAARYMDIIDSTLPRAGRVFGGPSSARNRLDELTQRFNDELYVLEQQAQGADRKTQRDLRSEAIALQNVIRRIERGAVSLSAPIQSQSQGTVGGVTWSIVE